VLVKPNLVESLLPPITTPVALIEALVDYLQSHTTAKIIIGEGTGAMNYNTWHPFNELGYSELAKEKGVDLVDLNEAELIFLKKEECLRWPQMYLPKIVCDSFLLSVPVLKAHSLAGVTLTMKNMMGCVPPSHYRQGNSWKKSAFHNKIQESVADLNRYRKPDFTLLDATVGMPEAHLWGPSCDPPVNILAAGSDPVAMDAYGSGLLGIDWQCIGHIQQVHRELGCAHPLEIIKIPEGI
jgi:uncharacterized protein (DUF362 family)